MSRARRSHNRGFTLVEALVALALIVTAAASLAQLFLQSTSLMLTARRAPVVLAAAQSKIEQLRALSFTFDVLGAPVADISSDTAQLPPAPAGGTGLQPSPADSLERDADGFVDYLDAHGRPLGGGLPPDAAYVRRWAITELETDVLEIRACVWTIVPAGAPPETCLLTVRTRRP